MESVKFDLSACLTFLFTSCLQRLHHDLKATKTTTLPCLGQLPPAELMGGWGWVQYQVQLLLQNEAFRKSQSRTSHQLKSDISYRQLMWAIKITMANASLPGRVCYKWAQSGPWRQQKPYSVFFCLSCRPLNEIFSPAWSCQSFANNSFHKVHLYRAHLVTSRLTSLGTYFMQRLFCA